MEQIMKLIIKVLLGQNPRILLDWTSKTFSTQFQSTCPIFVCIFIFFLKIDLFWQKSSAFNANNRWCATSCSCSLYAVSMLFYISTNSITTPASAAAAILVYNIFWVTVCYKPHRVFQWPAKPMSFDSLNHSQYDLLFDFLFYVSCFDTASHPQETCTKFLASFWLSDIV